EVEDADARGEGECFGVRIGGERARVIPDGSPVTQRGGGVRVRGPLGRATVPPRALEAIAGFLPVVRDERGAFVETVGVDVLQGTRDVGVHAATALAELRAVRDLLRERMLERVLGLRE